MGKITINIPLKSSQNLILFQAFGPRCPTLRAGMHHQAAKHRLKYADTQKSALVARFKSIVKSNESDEDSD